MRGLAICLGVLFMAAPEAARAATVMPDNGQVLVNSGDGFLVISGPTTVVEGDSVMVFPGGSAIITYDSGCRRRVRPGEVVSISEHSPCSAGAAEIVGETAGPPVDFALVAAGGVAAVGGINIAIKDSDAGSGPPTSP